jgi:ATP-binding cassette, subfamily C, bacterial LapB
MINRTLPILEADVLQRLLQQLNITVDTLDLQCACVKVLSTPANHPAERLRMVLTQVQVKGVQAAYLMFRRLDLRRLPALVTYQNTWCLVERTPDQNDTMTLTDGAGTVYQVPRDELQNAGVLWLRATPTQPTRHLHSALKGNLAAAMVWRELFREKGWMYKVVLATCMVNLLAVGTSLYSMQVYDRVVPTLAWSTLTTLTVGMVLLLGLDWMLKIVRGRILDSMADVVDKRCQQQVFEHLLHLQLDVQPKSLGTLAAQVSGLDSVRQFFSSTVIFALIDLPFALFFILIIALIGSTVSVVYIALLPVALLMGWWSQMRLSELMRLQLQRSNERQGVLVDAIRGAESIRAGNATWRFSEQWQAITASMSRYQIQQKAIVNMSSVSASSLSTLAYVAALVVGVGVIAEGHMTAGALIACSILGGRVIAPIAQSVQYVTQWQGVAQALQMVNQVLELSRERRPDQTLMLPDAAPHSVAVERVKFAYPESPVQQIQINKLDFQAGERVLLLGPVGCGKSTLLKVIAGLYRPNEGRVRLGDADLWETDPLLVASQIGYLPQTVHLFKGTLRSNLSLSGTASDSRLLGIMRALGVDAIAAGSPQGMDMQISEGGEGLSGGQRQLVALARVAIAEPVVWLLDEPTASLDGESEARVWQLIAQQIKPNDILVVATHKPLLAARLATRVVVMDRGEVLRDGKPEQVTPQLMAQAMQMARAAEAAHTGLGAKNV